jgi:hypothetical protein
LKKSKIVSYTYYDVATGDAITPKAVSKCNLCVTFASDALNKLISIIANTGIVGGCQKVCSQLDKEWQRITCDVICVGVGIEAFFRVLDYVSPDPILFC